MKAPIFFALWLFSSAIFAQSLQFAQEGQKIKSLVESFHYQPHVLNKNYSEAVFDLFVDDLDPYHLLFTQVEINELKALQGSIQSSIDEDTDCELIENLTLLYPKILERAQKKLEGFNSQKLNFNENESFSQDELLTTFAKDDAALTIRWKKWLKLFALYYGEDLVAEDSTLILNSACAKVHDKAINHFSCFLEDRQIEEEKVNALLSYYLLDALAHRLDPHTVFFTARQKQIFESFLSTEEETFGISFEKNEQGMLMIGDLAPGSAAWRSNLLHSGDKIKRIQWAEDDVVDLDCISPQGLEQSLNSDPRREITLVIQTDAGESQIRLEKGLQEVQENTVTGFLLKGEKTMGYMAIPSFYTEWAGDRSQGVAQDVAKELLKLKMENIEGLVIDLRDNGGGSLAEASRFAGIFINVGPLALSKDQTGAIEIIKDMSRGSIFNGPLVILLNGNSASASEILAGSLQDHGRAVIVGGQSYGKFSSQIVLPLDIHPTQPDLSQDFTNSNYLKVTISQLFRLNGGSSQTRGVTPDILLPDPKAPHITREVEHNYVLLPDSVVKKVYFQPKALPIQKLQESSAARRTASKHFEQVAQLNQEIIALEEQEIPLNAEAFQAYSDKKLTTNTALWDLVARKSEAFKVANNSFDESVLSLDEIKRQLNEQQKEHISHDIYVEEAFEVLCDMTE